MPLNARRYLRKMRGGAQAHLIEAEDGRAYVVKFLQNPQHRRILVNELVAARLLAYLEVPAPSAVIIQVDEQFLGENPEVCIQLGERRQAVFPGWHFGSCFGSCNTGDPERLVVYDFLPDAILAQVANLRDFLGALVFDKWMANADSRQAIFFRAKLRDWRGPLVEPGHGNRTAFVGIMIDHGFVFNGPHWEFADSPLQGAYFRPLVYEQVTGWEDFQPWLSRVEDFPEEILDRALAEVPRQWLEGDEESDLARLLEVLLRRRRRVADLVEETGRRGRVELFPRWS